MSVFVVVAASIAFMRHVREHDHIGDDVSVSELPPITKSACEVRADGSRQCWWFSLNSKLPCSDLLGAVVQDSRGAPYVLLDCYAIENGQSRAVYIRQ